MRRHLWCWMVPLALTMAPLSYTLFGRYGYLHQYMRWGQVSPQVVSLTHAGAIGAALLGVLLSLLVLVYQTGRPRWLGLVSLLPSIMLLGLVVTCY